VSTRKRRLGGWGFEGEGFAPSSQLVEWLEAHVGPPGPAITGDTIQMPGREPQALPLAPSHNISTEPEDRLAHARGQGLADVIRVRTGTVRTIPDAVVRATSAAEVEEILRTCDERGIRVVPWGGGTSVTGGVNTPDGGAPVLVIDLEAMSGLLHLDTQSNLAVFGPGTPGPRVEAELGKHGLTLGHFPQSWELATVGGWVATRSSGQESLGYGRIESMVAGLELVAPSGKWQLPALPASAAGPDLRHLVMGSEGRFGIITEVTLRVRARPHTTVVDAYIIADIERGMAAVRTLVRSDLPLSMVRLSDPRETLVAMAVGLGSSAFAPLVRGYLRLRGVANQGCLMLVGAKGEDEDVADALTAARSVLGRHHAVSLGRQPGRKWQRDRFHHPYLREALLDRGWATDTLETAVPWSRALETRRQVVNAIAETAAAEGERAVTLCHVSHPYRDGTSLYFTFFFRTAPDADRTIARWAGLKRATSEALIACAATISHHHGVGSWHAPWLEPEIGQLGRDILLDAAQRFDPRGILNPQVLLDPTDRLED